MWLTFKATRNPQPATRNPQPATRNPHPLQENHGFCIVWDGNSFNQQ
jgi:hypothetical protein